jgi:hypothetical protein
MLSKNVGPAVFESFVYFKLRLDLPSFTLPIKYNLQPLAIKRHQWRNPSCGRRGSRNMSGSSRPRPLWKFVARFSFLHALRSLCRPTPSWQLKSLPPFRPPVPSFQWRVVAICLGKPPTISQSRPCTWSVRYDTITTFATIHTHVSALSLQWGTRSCLVSATTEKHFAITCLLSHLSSHPFSSVLISWTRSHVSFHAQPLEEWDIKLSLADALVRLAGGFSGTGSTSGGL